MWNPIKQLIDAYLKGREMQMERLDKQNELLERIAVALEKLLQK